MSSSLTSTYLTKSSLESSRVTSYGDLASTASLFLLDGSLDVLRITRSPRSSSVGSRSIETTFRRKETLNDNIIRAFESAQFGTVRALSVDGEPQLVAADVARALGYRKASDMLRSLDADEKVLNAPEENGSSDGAHTVRPLADQQFYTITEAGFYRIVLQRKTACIGDDATRAYVEAFQRWVTHDVLQALRRDGAYVASDGTEDDATLMARALGVRVEDIYDQGR